MPEDTLARTRLWSGCSQAISDAHYPPDLAPGRPGTAAAGFRRNPGLPDGDPGPSTAIANVTPPGYRCSTAARRWDGFLSALPFTSHPSRRSDASGEILADMSRGTPPMSRLLQGEVGSGKTLVALTAILAAASDQRQAALMAPTEVLVRAALRHGRAVCCPTF